MKTWFRWFNINFALATIFLAAGCSTMDPTHSKKEQTTLRLYMEGERADLTHVGRVLVTRNKDPFVVEREAFLDEADIVRAALVDDPSGDGTFYIEVAYNEHGALVLDMMTASNKGKHIIVFSQFPPPGEKQPKARKKEKKNDDDDDPAAEQPPPPAPPPQDPNKPRKSAWLTAVLIRDRISNGIFRFIPDASHDEAARIVRGLKNVIQESKRADKWNL